MTERWVQRGLSAGEHGSTLFRQRQAVAWRVGRAAKTGLTRERLPRHLAPSASGLTISRARTYARAWLLLYASILEADKLYKLPAWPL